MTINIGTLDRHITLTGFTASSPSQNALGEEAGAFATSATVWASRRDDRGTEAEAQQGRQAERFTVFKIRWRTDVRENMRVTDEGTVYDIQRIARLGRQDALELYCRAVNPEET